MFKFINEKLKQYFNSISGISGITKKWFLNYILVFILILGALGIIACFGIRSYYYNTATIALESKYTNLINTYFSNYINDTDEIFIAGSKKFVEEFSDKNMIEVWVIDKNGTPVATSSGFNIKASGTMPDYTDALKNSTGRSIWTGENNNGEKIKAFTVILKNADSQNFKNSPAVRYIVSLEAIDNQLKVIYIYIFIAVFIIIMLIYISGHFFIGSIVNPMNYICENVKRVAKGDYTVKLVYSGDDEIYNLCETINTMVKDISDSDKIKNDFISTISHEIRTPLTAIKGWGETLLQIGETDPILLQKGMGVIINESQRLSGLVEDLLDFSRIQNGDLKLKKEKIDVLAELDEAVFIFKDNANRGGIELTYLAPEEPAPMIGDPNRITQVFSNILDNALKYTEQGGKVFVKAEILEDRLKITFTDTGCGISPEDLPRIKEKFYKTSINYRGSGIGLAVADEIIKLHDGQILIDSKLGEGTIVTIFLPIEAYQAGKILKELENNE